MSKKENLEKKKKLQKLKSRAEEVKKSAGQMMDEAESRWKKDFGRKYTSEERKDAWREVQTRKRYEDVGVSPIYGQNTSPNAFSRNSKDLDEKFGSRLTEDDKVPSTSKKRGRRQY